MSLTVRTIAALLALLLVPSACADAETKVPPANEVPFPVIARFGQGYDDVPWDIEAKRNRQGTFITWVTEVNGQIELGSIALPEDF